MIGVFVLFQVSGLPGYAGLSPLMPPPGLPGATLGSGLHGAFQPKVRTHGTSLNRPPQPPTVRYASYFINPAVHECLCISSSKWAMCKILINFSCFAHYHFEYMHRY